MREKKAGELILKENGTVNEIDISDIRKVNVIKEEISINRNFDIQDYLTEIQKEVFSVKNNLKKLRKNKGMTQIALQMATGIEQALLSKYENGERIPLTIAGADKNRGTVKIIFQILLKNTLISSVTVRPTVIVPTPTLSTGKAMVGMLVV